MTCDEAQNLLDAWYDGELDAPRSAAMERHLEECPGCSAISGARSALSEVLVKAPRHAAPAALRKLVEAQLTTRPPDFRQARLPRPMPWRGIAMAASLTLFVTLGWNAWMLQARAVAQSRKRNRRRPRPLADGESSVGCRLGRSAYGEAVVHRQARLRAAGGRPRERRLQAAWRTPRLCRGHAGVRARVSASRHIINVFVWPTREDDDALPQPRWSNDHGYHLANWTHSGMTYWAISDVDPAELTRLANLLGAK